jgi:ribosome-binding protein aMBF1 (putative translation factor)
MWVGMDDELEDFLRAFGARVRELRLSLGLTQGELAERAGLSANHFGLTELACKANRSTRCSGSRGRSG